MNSFFRFFAERHILATLITLMIILLGLTTLMSIKRDIYPQVDFGMMQIVTRYPGASPEDVELNVTNKLEEELKSVTGIDNITSISMENVSSIMVTIEIDASDQDQIKSEIREAVNRVTDFPVEVTESPLINDLNSTNTHEIIEVGLSGDIPYRDLREYARIFEKKLKNVPGVSRLQRLGYRAREIKVEVSPQAISNYQIPMREVIAAVQRRNIRGTTGAFESYTSEKNLVTFAQFRNPQEVGDVIVRSSFDGPIIKVKDLALITDSFEDERVLSRMNGKSTISFVVFLSENGDVIRTCDAVKALVKQENQNLPENVEVSYTKDISRIVKTSFEVVLWNGLIGLVLIILILPIFLNFRTAFWVALGIPVAMLGTIYLLPLFGMYLDTITLSGMILVIGIIVDDAIIIAENISKRRELGDSPLDAAVNGMSEVFRPVVTTILTTFLVFAPMFFMPGIFGKFIVPIPLAISLALFISLLEVMIALPAHLVPSMKRRSVKSTGRQWFKNLTGRYRKVVYHVLKFRYLLIPIFIGMLGFAFWFSGKYIKFILFPTEAADFFYVGYEMPVGTPLKTTSAQVTKIEDIVAKLPEDELASFTTRIGTNPFIFAETENYGYVAVNLSPHTERSRTADQIVEALRLETKAFEGEGKIAFVIESGGPPVGKPVSLRIVGSNDQMRT
ncbi:MAG: AcrB/AcrD/AcrF family protein, partial [Calditrichaeota bacterium]